ncbi:MBOAT family O-acyltransferase [Anaerocolumna sp. MB42-C2]|uniref:MBOAT family O-acyltransferase n=1 Tax=Anaerocolumna sp. MB42-C2 TaxID=3070997 RepID=UPI0027E09823|nr:MBOAT family O-acyltransferase [Anaerocolumna sp. MB42-C2]WMJ89851.1 MBOAT family O-acyltransferase [Anaerocolumna sp. MB42-C2]
MVFSSLEFIFRFLPVFLILYYTIPIKYRNLVLFLGSICFYALGDTKSLILIFLSIVINHVAVKNMEHARLVPMKRKMWLLLALFYNFGILFFFKYINFTIDNINYILKLFSPGNGIPSLEVVLPLGISFYTFQAVSYVIDVYKGEVKETTSLFNFGTYLLMFPKLVSGPIATYNEIREQLTDRSYNLIKFEKGLKLFTIGLGIKVLLANRLGILWNDIQTIGFQSISTPLAWLGAVGYSLQLYFDFSGYSLMAIGIGKMLGFTLPNNFTHPYMAKSVSEFWRRWHITLGMWFKNYVYIPLGGNRAGKKRLVFNLLAVWLFTGLWHGASWNYVLWGLVLFLLILLEKLYLKPVLDRSRVISRIYILLILPMTWMLFAINDLKDIAVYFGRMFGITAGINVNTYDVLKYLDQFKWLLIAGIFFCFPYGFRWFAKHDNSIPCTIILIIVFWYSVYNLSNGLNNPFMYFNF